MKKTGFLFTIKMSKYEIYFRVDIFQPRFNQLSHCEKKLQLCNQNINNVFDNLKGKTVLKTTDVLKKEQHPVLIF